MTEPPPEIDTSRPHPARMYDYFLGGENHFAADRETAETVLATAPTTRIAARENRAFLGRAVRYLVAAAGVRQFLDIGTGLPTVPLQVRDSGELAALAFAGLELEPPGVVLVSEWRPEASGPRPAPSEVNCYGGVARKR